MHFREDIASKLRAEVDRARSEYLRASGEFLRNTRDMDYVLPPDGRQLVEQSARSRQEAFQRYRQAVRGLTSFVLTGVVEERTRQ